MSSHASSMHSPFTRERACTLVDTFRVPSFQPFISSNGHFQSILSHLYPPPPKLSYKRVSIRTDDGLDEVAIDIAGGSSLAPEDDDHPKPVALILHGLESSSTGVVTLRIADALLAAGFKVLAMNYRSCAADAGPPTSIRLYHAGFIDDVKTVLTATRAAAESLGKQPRPIFIVGFSLGANVLCNLLRDAGEEAFEKYRIVSAFGICVPFDPGHCQKTIDYGFRQVLYSSRLVSSMKNRFEAALRTGVDVGEIDVNAVRSAATIGDIDDSIIAPTFGFNDRYDYYRKVSSVFIIARELQMKAGTNHIPTFSVA